MTQIIPGDVINSVSGQPFMVVSVCVFEAGGVCVFATGFGSACMPVRDGQTEFTCFCGMVEDGVFTDIGRSGRVTPAEWAKAAVGEDIFSHIW